MRRSSKLRLILADDHPVLRDGLSLILDAQPDMAVARLPPEKHLTSFLNMSRMYYSWIYRCRVREA